MSSNSVEDASASLVREYLSRKGLKSTLQKLDEELPRSQESISNRQILMKHLNLDKLMKKNKEEPEPLKAMLEVMTKYFMHRRLPGVTENNNAIQGESSSHIGLGLNASFGPQTDKPIDPALKSKLRPSTAALSARKEKRQTDLIVDENVSGETLMGSGKTGLMVNDVQQELPPQFNLKAQPSRPVSAKQRSGMIISNNDALSKGGRHFNRPMRGSVSQLHEQQQKRDMKVMQSNSHSAGELTLNGKQFSDTGQHPMIRVGSATGNRDNFDFSVSPKDFLPRKKSATEDPPVSFEALLMKGEERANLLQRVGVSNKNAMESEQSYNVETSSMVGDVSKIKSKIKKSESPPSNSALMQDLEFGDFDDHDSSFQNLELKPAYQTIQKPTKLTKIPSSPIDLKTAIALKNIVLGSSHQRYNEEWLLQAFTFCDMLDLKYGIVQKKGGPCGVLAAVQACLVQEMLFGKNKVPQSFKNLSRQERSRMLAFALSTILWRAGGCASAVVTIASDTSHIVSSTKFKHDDVTEKLELYTFTTYEELSSFLLQSIYQFETDGRPGVIQTMYSAILSRKSHRVRADFDVPEENTLIGSHGYCTQELVNLLLTGKAVSNVFNDTIQLDTGTTGEPVILKGVSGRTEIGFLSLFEHYKSCQ
ncbi:ubiquitin carboxyl-terminal hydrolase MINDY-3, partial [Elysia marginata]